MLARRERLTVGCQHLQFAEQKGSLTEPVKVHASTFTWIQTHEFLVACPRLHPKAPADLDRPGLWSPLPPTGERSRLGHGGPIRECCFFAACPWGRYPEIPNADREAAEVPGAPLDFVSQADFLGL